MKQNITTLEELERRNSYTLTNMELTHLIQESLEQLCNKKASS